LPREGSPASYESSWWYRAINWNVPPEGQRGIGFAFDTAAAILIATIILYVAFSRWQRRLDARKA